MQKASSKIHEYNFGCVTMTRVCFEKFDLFSLVIQRKIPISNLQDSDQIELNDHLSKCIAYNVSNRNTIIPSVDQKIETAEPTRQNVTKQPGFSFKLALVGRATRPQVILSILIAILPWIWYVQQLGGAVVIGNNYNEFI